MLLGLKPRYFEFQFTALINELVDILGIEAQSSNATSLTVSLFKLKSPIIIIFVCMYIHLH